MFISYKGYFLKNNLNTYFLFFKYTLNVQGATEQELVWAND